MTEQGAISPFAICSRLVQARAGQGVAVTVLYERRARIEWCCGQPMLRFGVRHMDGTKVTFYKAWFSCPCCYDTYRVLTD